MILHLVTDRRRLIAGTDPEGGPASARECLLTQTDHAIEAGIDYLQVREPDLGGALLADLVSEMLRRARGSRTRILVNDRLDVAVATGAHGVHLRGDSISVAEARRLAPSPFIVGRSCTVSRKPPRRRTPIT
jgi:thiamine-phosphate pyrophosphorylase